MSIVSVGDFNALKAALSSCLGNSIANDTIIELTSNIVVTETLRIGKDTHNVKLRSSTGNIWKLTPGASFRDSFITVGETWCSSSGTITDLEFKDLEFSGVTQINGGITLGPVYIGALDGGDTIKFNNVHFKDNSCPEVSALSPVGLRIDEGTVSITDCVFENNQAKGIAGAALFIGGDATVDVASTKFKENGQQLPLGGAAAYIKGDATFTNCFFDSNSVDLIGGAITLDAGSSKNVSFADCTFSGNTAITGNDFYIKSDNHYIDFSPCAAIPDCDSAAGGCSAICGNNDGFDQDLNDLANAVGAVVGLGIGVLVGIAVGGVVAVILAIVGCYFCCCRKPKIVQVAMVEQPKPMAA